MKTFVALAAGVLLVASSCSEKVGVDFGEQSALELNGRMAFDAAEGVKAWSAAKAATTKAEEVLGDLPATDLGVYVLTTAGKEATTDFSTTDWKNVAFVSDGAGNITNGAGAVTLKSGNTYDIYAYAPRVSDADLGAVDPGNVKLIPVNHGDDLLWAKTSGVVAKAKKTPVTLKFYHSGAQIGFNIRMKDGGALVDPATSGVQLEVSGFYKKGVLDVETGKMTFKDADKDPDLVLSDFTGAKTTILVPSGDKLELGVKVTNVPGQDGKTFSGTLPLVANSGESYLYDVNIDTDSEGHSSITFTATVEEWVPVEATTPVPIG